jgi:Cdc6-like AAA superfamily ATPase
MHNIFMFMSDLLWQPHNQHTQKYFKSCTDPWFTRNDTVFFLIDEMKNMIRSMRDHKVCKFDYFEVYITL